MRQKVLYAYQNDSLIDTFTDVLQEISCDMMIVHGYKNIHEHALNKQPHLVMIDVDFDDEIAYKACEQLCSNCPDIPVLVLSTSNQLGRIKEVCKASAFMAKPFVLNEFYTTVNNLLESKVES